MGKKCHSFYEKSFDINGKLLLMQKGKHNYEKDKREKLNGASKNDTKTNREKLKVKGKKSRRRRRKQAK